MYFNQIVELTFYDPKATRATVRNLKKSWQEHTALVC